MYHISFYVPLDHADRVKDAMFEAGAGTVGDYDRACWQTIGMGQFRPLEGSNPAIGSTNRLEKVQEAKIEMICPENCIKNVVQALMDTHPYEEPAWFGIKAVTSLGDILE